MWNLFVLFFLLSKGDIVVIITTRRSLGCASFLDRQRGITNVLILHPRRHLIVDLEFTLCKVSLIHANLNTLCPIRSLLLRRLQGTYNRWAVQCTNHCRHVNIHITFSGPSFLSSSVTNHMYSTNGRNPSSSRSLRPKPMYGGICRRRGGGMQL